MSKRTLDSNNRFLSIDTLKERLIDQEEMSNEEAIDIIRSYINEYPVSLQITFDKLSYKENLCNGDDIKLSKKMRYSIY